MSELWRRGVLKKYAICGLNVLLSSPGFFFGSKKRKDDADDNADVDAKADAVETKAAANAQTSTAKFATLSSDPKTG